MPMQEVEQVGRLGREKSDDGPSGGWAKVERLLARDLAGQKGARIRRHCLNMGAQIKLTHRMPDDEWMRRHDTFCSRTLVAKLSCAC